MNKKTQPVAQQPAKTAVQGKTQQPAGKPAGKVAAQK